MVFIPVYFFTLSNSFIPVEIPFLPQTLLEIIVRLVTPIVLSIPFVVFSFYQRYEVSEAYENMGETISNLPNSIKAFYGFNFFMVVLFGLPFIAPIISISGGYFLGLLLFGKKEDMVQISRPIIKIITLLFIPFSIFISIIFISQVGQFFNDLSALWINNINFIYLTSLNIANGALISGAILLMFEYVEKDSFSFEKPPFINTLIGITTFIGLELFLVYFFYYTEDGLTGTQYLIFIAVNVIGFILSIFVLIVRSLIKDSTEEGTGILGWLTILVFQMVNILSSESLAVFSRTIAILLTSLIFILLFFISYKKALNYV